MCLSSGKLNASRRQHTSGIPQETCTAYLFIHVCLFLGVRTRPWGNTIGRFGPVPYETSIWKNLRRACQVGTRELCKFLGQEQMNSSATSRSSKSHSYHLIWNNLKTKINGACLGACISYFIVSGNCSLCMQIELCKCIIVVTETPLRHGVNAVFFIRQAASSNDDQLSDENVSLCDHQRFQHKGQANAN